MDPNDNSILYFGARSGHGLWKSTNYGQSWSQVIDFPSVGTYIEDPSDSTGYESDIVGIAWVTFDPTSGTSGTPTPRIFVGVANLGSNSVFVTENAGGTWTAVAGQNTTYIPHKGVLAPDEGTLYVTYSNGAGPYDGTLGSVYKYDISASVWTDITPVSGSDLYFGFGGLAIDLLSSDSSHSVIMVAALNSWWPDGQMYRSNDSGSTWSPLWEWTSYPNLNRYYSYSDSNAPWIGPDYTIIGIQSYEQVGWMMEGLVIDPFDSNHWLYGTGETLYGGHNLLNWDTVHNVTIESLAVGIEETSVQAVISPPTGPSLVSAMGDVDGFVHTSLTTAPENSFLGVAWSTTVDIDFAGQEPTNMVRIGNTDSTVLQIAVSTDSGNSWSQDYGAQENVTGGHVAYSANADIVLWSSQTNGVIRSQYTDAFTAVSSLPSGSIIAADRLNDSVFYAASGSSFYLSTNGAVSFTKTAGSLASSSSPVKIVVNPSVQGDVWVSSDVGLFHSTNFGSTFTAVSGVTEAWAIGLGAPASSGGYPAVFAAATISGTTGYFRSDNEGSSFVQINDAAHGFGSAASNVLTGDPRIYGRVYIGTNGRGVFYGDISGSVTSTTSSSSSTSSTSSTSKSSTTITTTSSKTTTTTSTTKSSSTTSTSTSTSATSTGTSPVYGQCGGTGYTGPTTCATGSACTYGNPYYSQCVPT